MKFDIMMILFHSDDDDNLWHSTNQLDWVRRLMAHLQNFHPHPNPRMNHFQSHLCLGHLIQKNRLQIDQNEPRQEK